MSWPKNDDVVLDNPHTNTLHLSSVTGTLTVLTPILRQDNLPFENSIYLEALLLHV